MIETQTQQHPQDGRAGFDFIIGRWNVHHLRLREWLKGSTSWEEFDGTTVDRGILGGMGNIGEAKVNRESGPQDFISVRLFDPQSRQWSVYFANSTSGAFSIPMFGSFTQGRGEFYGQEALGEMHVFTRFVYSDITATSCRWEQAFSDDGGRTWETNWIMELTRQQE